MTSTGPAEAPSTAMLRALFADSHRVAPDEVVPMVQRAAAAIGASEVHVYLVDYARERLIPVPEASAEGGKGAPVPKPLTVDSSDAGTCFIRQEIVLGESGGGGGGQLMWIPLLDGTERVGVMHIVAPDDPEIMWLCMQLAAISAELLVSKGRSGDLFSIIRRSRNMSLAAEMQWQILPPMQIASGNVAIAGMLEPAYDVGGDAFDYAINGDTAHIGIFDAMGHGLSASVMCTVTVTAYRHARRGGHGLDASAAMMDSVFADQFGGDRFVTAQFGTLDRPTGVLRWISAGHPAPLLVRDRRVVGPLACEPALPIGFNERGSRPVSEEQLQPGDKVFFYSDGMVEARDADGVQYGLHRLVDGLNRALATDLPPNEVLRRLSKAVLDHHDSPHQDDATVVMLEWQGAGEAGVEGMAT